MLNVSSETESPSCSRDEFARMLEASLSSAGVGEGSVVKGRVVGREKGVLVVDVGLKTEGRVSIKEFVGRGRDEPVDIGSEVEVYLERFENALGEAVLSREKARREEAWERLGALFSSGEKVEGRIFGPVKGGYTVDLDGAFAFLPRSQLDVRPLRDVSAIMRVPQQFRILKMDRRRGNIVVSRRSVLEEDSAERKQEVVRSLTEGQVIEGVVKNTTDYGAFVDLGGIDGLLHVTDIAWRRVNHPSDVLSSGQKVKVKIIKVNQETHRVSLSMKQLEPDPWEGIAARYPVGARLKGKVTNVTDYGAFVELEPGVEGLIHVSEMSWTRKNLHPGRIVSPSQEIEVVVLDFDVAKRRISLGYRQTVENPWQRFLEENPPGTLVEGEVRGVAEFGLFVGLGEDLDGMVHLSDLDWKLPGAEAVKKYEKGSRVKAVVLSVDVERERVALGIKQLSADRFAGVEDFEKGSVVTCEVLAVREGGLEVKIVDTDLTAFIRRSDLSRERSEQDPARFAVGRRVDAIVTQVDKKSRGLSVSIKALEVAEEREAVARYGSASSGASLGSILGAALSEAGFGGGKEKEDRKEEV